MTTVLPDLRMSRNSGPPRLSVSLWGMLLGVVLAVVVLSDLSVVHAHDAPGLYDEQCPLERLAAGAPYVSLPQALDVPNPVPALDPVPTVLVTASVGVPFASFESRAPPVLVLGRPLAP